MKSKDIAISAISASLCAIVLTIGSYFEMVDVIMIAIATLCVMMPLYKESYLGSFLSYLAGGVIAFLLGGMNIQKFIYPAYFLFAGAYPVVNALFKRYNVNKWLAYFIKMIWCILAFYFIYWLCTYIFGIDPGNFSEFIDRNIWYILAVASIIFYVMFDFCINRMQWVVNKYLSRIIK